MNIGTERSTLATLTRVFSWATLALLLVYLVSSVLTVTFEWPGPLEIFSGVFDVKSIVQLMLYAGAIAYGFYRGFESHAVSLRAESESISRFNTWLVRGAFFAVLFVGIGDAIISFMRVENLLEATVGEQSARDFGRSSWRGTYIHLPLIALGFLVALVTRTLGFIWLSLLIVAAELLIVISRFVFSYEQAFMGDLVRFWYAALFLFASAYTLIEEGHVRVDVFYASFSTRTKGIVNAIGSIFLGMVLCWTILIIGLEKKSSIVYAPLRSFETSQSGYGLYVKYLMAGFLAVFAITMLIQFVSYLLSAVADLRDEPGHTDHESSATQG
jgi:TRAP-type mannitol/chloroaromatic compound transport system permease small subunit